MAIKALADADVTERLAGHPAWKVADGVLERRLRFPDFRAAFAFMTQVALCAEAANHHPDWQNSWNRVTVRLSTHEAGGGITERDFALAAEIDAIVPSA